MKSISFILSAFICLGSIQSDANPSPDAQATSFAFRSVCLMKAEDFLEKSRRSENLTSLHNAPGPLGTGLCWWHSKLQRASIYLAVFDQPGAPRPSETEALQILKDLAELKKVISIPGFKNWSDFTAAYTNAFYQVLGDWEIKQSLQFEFVKGLRFLGKTDNHQLQKISREVNDYKRVTFVLLKMPHLEAHSWLLNSFLWSQKDFEVSFIDSNAPLANHTYKSRENTYVFQDTYKYNKLSYGPQGEIVTEPDFSTKIIHRAYPNQKGLAYRKDRPMALYLQNANTDFLKITQAIRSHCKGDTAFTLHEQQVQADKEKHAVDQINWWRPGVPHN